MKTLSMIAVVAMVGLMGCQNSKGGSAGAMDSCSDKAACEKPDCCKKDGAMGAAGEKKGDCCSGMKGGSMGAVEAKTECTGAKAACPSSGGCTKKN